MIRVFFAIAIFIALLVLLAMVVWSGLRQDRAKKMAKKFAEQAANKFANTVALARKFKRLYNKGACWRGTGSGGGKIGCQTCARRNDCERSFVLEFTTNIAERVRGGAGESEEFAWEFQTALEYELQKQELSIKLAELQLKLDQAAEEAPIVPELDPPSHP